MQMVAIIRNGGEESVFVNDKELLEGLLSRTKISRHYKVKVQKIRASNKNYEHLEASKQRLIGKAVLEMMNMICHGHTPNDGHGVFYLIR